MWLVGSQYSILGTREFGMDFVETEVGWKFEKRISHLALFKT